jgi:putative addiction module component (TIGR02574 family)
MNTILDQARQLSVEEQLELVEALWDEIVEHGGAPLPTRSQREELDRRLADHSATPDDVTSWDDARAAALDRIRR